MSEEMIIPSYAELQVAWQRLRAELIEKDAEIERLKASLEQAHKLNNTEIKRLDMVVYEQKQLIAKLLEWADKVNKEWDVADLGLDPELPERAREAGGNE